MLPYLLLAAAQAVGGYQQGEMIRKSAEVKSSIDEMNAHFIEIDAYNAEVSGYSNAAKYATTVNAVEGKQKSILASQDVAIGYGTAGAIAGDSKTTAMLNTLELQRQGRQKALGYKMQAINTRLGSQMTQAQAAMDASAAQASGIMGGAKTLIGGAERSNSTGTGLGSKSGTNNQTWNTPVVEAKAPTIYDNGYGWYPDGGRNGEPGYFGRGPRHEDSLFSDNNWSMR